jgi:hypothetical protein
LAALLAEPLAVDDFQNAMTLKEFLDKLTAYYRMAKGKEVLIQVDQTAFKEENPDAPDILDTQITCFRRPLAGTAPLQEHGESMSSCKKAEFVHGAHAFAVLMHRSLVPQGIGESMPPNALFQPEDQQIGGPPVSTRIGTFCWRRGYITWIITAKKNSWPVPE